MSWALGGRDGSAQLLPLGASEGDMPIQMFTRCPHRLPSTRGAPRGDGEGNSLHTTHPRGGKSVFEVDFFFCVFCVLLPRSSPFSPPWCPVLLFQLENRLSICFIVLPWLLAMQDHEMGSVTLLDTFPGLNFILRSWGFKSPKAKDIALYDCTSSCLPPTPTCLFFVLREGRFLVLPPVPSSFFLSGRFLLLLVLSASSASLPASRTGWRNSSPYLCSFISGGGRC